MADIESFEEPTDVELTAEQGEALLRQLGIIPSYDLTVLGVDAEGDFFSDLRTFDSVEAAVAALAETENEAGVIAVQADGSFFFRLPVVNAVRRELGLEDVTTLADTEEDEA